MINKLSTKNTLSESNLKNDSSNEQEGPLQIAVVELPNQSSLGITPFPGRNHTDDFGRIWQRDLNQDLAKIIAWGADSILTLVETEDFERLGVPRIAECIRAEGLNWYHMPIPNMEVPGEEFNAAWAKDGKKILHSLCSGGRLIIHCAAGLGRSGMIAAKILSVFNTPPQSAIAAVRKVRPGAIETAQQENYILSDSSLIEFE